MLQIDILPKEAQKEIRDFYEFLLSKYKYSLSKKQKRPFGLAKEEFIYPDNFNEPLPDDITKDFYN
ncbi:MAG: DUF2281 domain-containing protein [Cyclobacteriaceae bacterium]